MDWTDTTDQASFRDDVRDLIGQMPERYREMAKHDWPGSYTQWARDRISDDPAAKEDAAQWLGAFADRGWVAPHWPREYGGGGLSPMEQFILNQEIADSNAPGAGSNVGIGMLGPALIVHGTEEQKRRFLPPILAGEVVWAQGFSEPGAGSDLASLQTRAVRDGDEYVINGQKIWTTHGHYADWVLLLTRTDPEAPKHRGISFLLVDKYSPGVTVRPIIDMGWGHEVNETFFEDVRIPADQIVGEENRGWYVAMTLLDNERSNIAGAVRMERTIRQLIEYVGSAEGERKSRVPRSRVGAPADRAALRRGGRDVQLLAAHHHDPGAGPGAQLRGLGLEALRLGGLARARQRRRQGLRPLRQPLGCRRPACALRGAVHARLGARGPRDDRRRQLGGAAQRDRDARSRTPARLSSRLRRRPVGLRRRATGPSLRRRYPRRRTMAT